MVFVCFWDPKQTNKHTKNKIHHKRKVPSTGSFPICLHQLPGHSQEPGTQGRSSCAWQALSPLSHDSWLLTSGSEGTGIRNPSWRLNWASLMWAPPWPFPYVSISLPTPKNIRAGLPTPNILIRSVAPLRKIIQACKKEKEQIGKLYIRNLHIRKRPSQQTKPITLSWCRY